MATQPRNATPRKFFVTLTKGSSWNSVAIANPAIDSTLAIMTGANPFLYTLAEARSKLADAAKIALESAAKGAELEISFYPIAPNYDGNVSGSVRVYGRNDSETVSFEYNACDASVDEFRRRAPYGLDLSEFNPATETETE